MPGRAEPSLYDGLGGDVTAQRLLGPGSEQAALALLAELMTPRGWHTTLQIVPGSTAPVTDLIQGNAGVVLAAIWAGGEHARGIAATGGRALLDAADPAEGGLDWAMAPGARSRAPNYSHGTAGEPPRWPSPGRPWAARTSSASHGGLRLSARRTDHRRLAGRCR